MPLIVPDDTGPIELFPLRPGGPLRFRELTAREHWLWLQKSSMICGGGFWTAEMQAQAEMHYDEHTDNAHMGRKAAA